MCNLSILFLPNVVLKCPFKTHLYCSSVPTKRSYLGIYSKYNIKCHMALNITMLIFWMTLLINKLNSNIYINTYLKPSKTPSNKLQYYSLTHNINNSPPPTTTNATTRRPTPPTPPNQPPLGQAIQAIIKDKINTKKDKWGAQSITKSYLCQWPLSQGTTQQWRKEEELLHPNNISLEHNLYCITLNHTLIVSNHTQSKDNKYIHPPLKITNLQISIQDCNPDKDIRTNTPTIQIHKPEANIYDQRGNHIATLTTDRLTWLWNQFSHHTNTQPLTSLQPPSQNFET